MRMRVFRLIVGVLGLLALGLPSSLSGSGAAAAQQGRTVPDQYIVVLKDSVSDPRSVAQQHANAHALTVLYTYEHAIKGYAARIPRARLDDVRNDSRVEYVDEDREVEAFDHDSEHPTGVDRVDGELSSRYSSGSAWGIAVAVIDTGSGPHSDLNIAGGKNCSTGRSYNDGNGHGTHVAGTIGAKNNGTGVEGVAPGVPIYSVRVLNNSGSGSWSSVICGVDWVTGNAASKNIKVANMSLGGGGSEPSAAGCSTGSALHDAICRSVTDAKVTYVVAAGNSSDDAKNFVPAAYDEVITVSALADFNGAPGEGAASTCRADEDDTFANFSNHGTDVDLIAPGVCIRSTWKGGGYNTISGTSMASPHAAGAAALYIARNPTASPDQVKSGLQAAGNLNWNGADDPDDTKERLVNVNGL
jgi:subtilisin